MKFRLDDYIDADVSYFMGLITGRGTLSQNGNTRQILIEFPYSSLKIAGITTTFDQETAIRLGIQDIENRLKELVDTDIDTFRKENSIELAIRFHRNNMVWRDILLLTEQAQSYPYFKIPPVFFDPELPKDWKREFIRGYADVAGNIRKSNVYVDGRHRVRLDVLNYPTNWGISVELCRLLQEGLDIPVQLITWGHPNLKRDFREHQINIFAKPFLKIGFSFEHKQKILEELANSDKIDYSKKSGPCPGRRKLPKTPNPKSPDENNTAKLDPRLVGKHFDAYWQICKALGCTREPSTVNQLQLFDDAELEVIENVD